MVVVGEAKGTKLGAIIKSIKDVFRFWFRWMVLRRREIGRGHLDRLDPALWSREGMG